MCIVPGCHHDPLEFHIALFFFHVKLFFGQNKKKMHLKKEKGQFR